jgi:hypothetical protein
MKVGALCADARSRRDRLRSVLLRGGRVRQSVFDHAPFGYEPVRNRGHVNDGLSLRTDG